MDCVECVLFVFLYSGFSGIMDPLRLHGVVHCHHQRQPDQSGSVRPSSGFGQVRPHVESLHILHEGYQIQPRVPKGCADLISRGSLANQPRRAGRDHESEQLHLQKDIDVRLIHSTSRSVKMAPLGSNGHARFIHRLHLLRGVWFPPLNSGNHRKIGGIQNAQVTCFWRGVFIRHAPLPEKSI